MVIVLGVLGLIFILFYLQTNCQAQGGDNPQTLNQLSRELTDPTALIWQIQFEDYFKAVNYEDGLANNLRLKVVIPIRPEEGLGQQIRLNQTLETKNGVTGFGDFQFFDIFIPSIKD